MKDNEKNAHKPNPREKLKHIAIAIAVMDTPDQKYFIKEVFNYIAPEKRQAFVDEVVVYQFEDKGYWLKIDEWMTIRFRKNPKMKPITAARTVRYYWKMHHGMIPQLLKRARKIKDRIRKQQERAGEKEPIGTVAAVPAKKERKKSKACRIFYTQ